MKRILRVREHLRIYRKSQQMWTHHEEVSSSDIFTGQSHKLRSTGTFTWSDDMFKRNSFKEDTVAVLEVSWASLTFSSSMF